MNISIELSIFYNISFKLQVLDDRDSTCYTPLCKAVDNGYLDCAKLLVDKGADTNIVLPGDWSIIHLCAENNFFNMLSYFVKNTSAREKKDMRCHAKRGGMTPLQVAASSGYTDCVKVLLSSGCDVKVKSTEEPYLSSTALHMAARNGHDKVIWQIVNHDNDVLWYKDSHGWYPLHIAANNGHSKCVSIMIEFGADLADHIVDEKGTSLTGLEVILYCIPKSVEFLVEVFDSYIQVNNYPLSDPRCELKVKFDVLTPKTSCKQLRVLSAVINCGREKLQERLLLHPIVQTFLHLKWMKLRLFFYVTMVFYLIFTLSLSSLAVWNYILNNETSFMLHIICGILLTSLIPILLVVSILSFA